MIQVKQIVCAASAVVALGTMVNVQAVAAALTTKGAAIYRASAIGQMMPLARIGGARGEGSQTGSRNDVVYDASVAAKDRQWFSRATYYGSAQAGLEMQTGCSSYATCADKLFDKANSARIQNLTLSWNIGVSSANTLGLGYAAPLSAFAAPAGLWNKTEILPLEARDLAPDTDAEPDLVRSAFSGGKWLLLAYAGYLAALTLFQRRFVFNPAHAVGPAAEPADTHDIASVGLALPHDKAIKGWYLRPRQGAAPYPSIIYYGGRTEEVSWLRGAVKWFPNHAVLVLNYRGYGESGGDPSEKALFEDGLAQFDWLAAQPGVDPKAIVLVGRSLGTGVASYVAAKRPAARVVLITPYDSLLAVARRRFWFTPLSLLLRHKFKSVDYAKTNLQPCLALLAEHDDVVPEEHTHRLMACWAGAKKLVRIPRTTHMDIPYQAATLNAVAMWLGYASVPPGPLSLVAPAT